MNIRTGHFKADAGIVYLPLGFKPDFFMLADHGTATPLFYYFWSGMADMAAASKEGIQDSGGTKSKMADDAGITVFSTGSVAPTIIEYAAATTPTARSATAAGTFCRGSTSGTNDLGQAVDRDAIFECVGSTGAVSTEPTWPTAVGGQVTDAGSNVWERVNEPVKRAGYQGVCIQDNIQTSDREYFYLAIKSDDDRNHGDVDSWPSGIDQDWV